MKYRSLGRELRVSAIGIGCAPMIRNGNYTYDYADDDEAIRTIHEAIDRGIILFDTAEAYGPFQSEALLGHAIKGSARDLSSRPNSANAGTATSLLALTAVPRMPVGLARRR